MLALAATGLSLSLLVLLYQFIMESFIRAPYSLVDLDPTQPEPRACTVPRPYLARVRAHIEVRAGLDWTGWLPVKQAVQYLDLLRREQLPSHLLPEEVPPTVAVPVGQR